MTASRSWSNFGSWRWQCESTSPSALLRGGTLEAEPLLFLGDDRRVQLLEQGLSVRQRPARRRWLELPAGGLKRPFIAQIAVQSLAGEGQVGRERDVEPADRAQGRVEDRGAAFAVLADEPPGRVLFDVAVGRPRHRHRGG